MRWHELSFLSDTFCARAPSIRHDMDLSNRTRFIISFGVRRLKPPQYVVSIQMSSLYRFMSLLCHVYEKYVVKDVTLMLYNLVFMSS
jgi:hypothetical protein